MYAHDHHITIPDECKRLYYKDAYLSGMIARLKAGVDANGKVLSAFEIDAVDENVEATKRKKQNCKLIPMKIIPFELDKNGLLWFTASPNKRLCVPTVDAELLNRIIFENHDLVVNGHSGEDKTIYNVEREFYWKNMKTTIRNYVKHCQQCQRNKTIQAKPAGLLNPLDIPSERWISISMDYIVQLPNSNGYDAIWVIVCRLSKRIFLILSKGTDTAEVSAKRFFEQFLRIHDLPEEIVSDRDSKFTSKFWDQLMLLHGTKLRISSAFKPNTDGQTEIVNKFVEDYLRAFVGGKQNEWANYLGVIEKAFNTRVHSVHGKSPFEIDTGRTPRSHVTAALPKSSDKKRQNALKFKEKLDADLMEAQESLAHAQIQMQQYYNRNRKQQIFKVGDKVLLSTKKFSFTSCTANKRWSKKKIGTKIYRTISDCSFGRNK
jgi:hypothetical protein